MSMEKVVIRPGVNTQASQTLNQGGWSLGNLIRFKDALVEKMGGWQHLSATPLIGTARGLHAWEDLNAITYLAAGTEQRLEVYSSGAITDITPIRRTINAAGILSTVINTPAITVFDTNHGAVVGDNIVIPIPVAIGGLVLFGNYTVATVPDTNHYTFTAAGNATATVNLAGTTPAFSTTIASNVVNVNLAAHGLTIGGLFIVQVSVSVGGLTILGGYLVNTVVDANNFTILASAVAGATAGPVSENGGNTEIQYLLSTGLLSDTAVLGWGGGAYGSGTWGTSAGTSAILPHRDWFLEHFGQNLAAVYTQGPLYQWVPPVATGNVAALVTQAPSVNQAMFVGMPQQQVILLGASVAGIQDPLLIAWCDAGDLTSWVASITNQAGTFRLPRGARIVGGLQGPQFGLIWTDTELWGMQYSQPPFIYNFLALASGCGLIGAKAACPLGSDVLWMSTRGFFILGGQGVEPLPCSVFDKVFGNINTAQQSKSFAAANSLFNEAAFFYPSALSSEIDSYVKYNRVEKVWDYGSLVRTAWIDQNIFGPPIGVDGSKLLQQHELGTDADGVAMTGVFAESGYIDLANGEQFIFIDQLIPDFVWGGSGTQTLTLTIYATNEPGVAPTVYGPYTVTPTTAYMTIRARHRQIALKVQSDGLGVFWRIGAIRYRGAPDGRV